MTVRLVPAFLRSLLCSIHIINILLSRCFPVDGASCACLALLLLLHHLFVTKRWSISLSSQCHSLIQTCQLSDTRTHNDRTGRHPLPLEQQKAVRVDYKMQYGALPSFVSEIVSLSPSVVDTTHRSIRTDFDPGCQNGLDTCRRTRCGLGP